MDYNIMKNTNFKFINIMILSMLVFLVEYMVYIPMLNDFSFAMVILSVIGIVGFLCHCKDLINKKFIIYFVAFTILLLPGFLYSINFYYGVKTLIYNILSILMMIAGYTIKKKYKNDAFLKLLVLFSMIVSVCNIVFVFNSDLEWTFLNSYIAKFSIEPSSLNLFFQVNGNNVMDPNKAGTLFVNTNNASVYFIILLCVSIVLYISTNKKRYILSSGIIFIAEICTGCRTGVLTMAVLIIYYMFTVRKNTKRIFKRGFGIFLLICVITFVYWMINSEQILNITNRLSLEAILNDPREIIWEYAIKNLSIFGLGYGGWESVSQGMYGYLSGMPLHNHILIMLSWSGLFGVFGYLLFWLGIFKGSNIRWKYYICYNSLLRNCIIITVLVHGLLDNYFLQNLNILVIVFVLIGYTSCNIDYKLGERMVKE